jgi:N-acetylneuraminate synthase
VPKLNIGKRTIGDGEPTYLVADIAANHDGDLERAKMLIHLAAEVGADAVKFQHFRAPQIVSARGFEALGGQISHQEKWKKSVYEVYADASLPWEWTATLKAECDAANIDFFSAPYDSETVDMLDPHVSMFKIGSGDITWPEILLAIAKKGKPVFLATGASNILDVQRAVHILLSVNPQLVLMQCNTNYTADPENFKHINLNVLKAYKVMFPAVILGLSDHTPGHATALGAIALGACVLEKHFTDDTARVGPDHPFSMAPGPWREMVARIKELEAAMGTASKSVCENEKETVIVQRRSLRASRDLKAEAVLTREMIDVLRPAPADAIFPYQLETVLGMRLRVDLPAGEALRWTMLEPFD